MKKSLLLCAFAALAATASAETKVYWFTADKTGYEFDMMGMPMSISPNGEYAIINDDEMTQCYLWKKSDPTKIQLLNWTVDVADASGNKKLFEVPLDIRAINDAGTIAGAYRDYGSYVWKPYFQEMGGEVVDLPVPTWVLNMNFPIAISNDGKVIGGQLGGIIESKTLFEDEEKTIPQTFGGSWPAIWIKGADGEYECFAERDQSIMPDNQGFKPNCMYTDGTLEGTWLGGYLGVGVSGFIAGLYNNNKFTYFNNLTYVECPYFYKGQVAGYQGYELIDGKRDQYFSETDVVEGGIYCADNDGHFFGTLYHVGELPYNDNVEDENFGMSVGDTYTWGYYDVKTGKWTEADGYKAVNCALSTDVFFSGTNIYSDGIESTPENIANKFGFDTNGVNVSGVNRASADGTVLGMCYQTVDGNGVQHIHPFMVELDKQLVGVEDIVVDSEARQLILVAGGTIEVTGAENVAVYDLNGVKVSDKAISNVGTGTYVVVADGKSHKILVK